MPPPFDRVRRDFFSLQCRYEYRGTLGRGATGVVFSAFDRTLQADVAVKVLVLGVDVAEQEALARFKREVQLNRKVKHPNVARLHEFGIAGDLPFVTMELVPGRPLWAILTDEGRLPAWRAVPILRQIALGSHAAHELGIVHRDLKPHNVMVDASGAVAILDFGLARDARGGGPQITRAGDIVGTPHYLSPEQVVDQVSDARSDIWAIGVVAFRTLTGEHPFDGPSPLALCQAILDEPFPGTKLRDAEVPKDVSAIVARCLQKAPADRYQRADALATDLALADVGPAPGPGVAPSPPAATVQELAPRVLLVDDDDDIRGLLRRQLEKSGCRVSEARDGLDALEQLQSEEVDIVLMDVAMPRMDGFDATRILRSQPRLARLPVLMMSVFSDRSRLSFAIQSGATDFVSKHESVSRLLEKVWALVRRS